MTNKNSAKQIELHHEVVREEIDKLVKTNITNCKDIIDKLHDKPNNIFNLFIASKASGIYNCKESCTIDKVKNQNIILNSISNLLKDKKIVAKLPTLCVKDDEECKRAINSFKDKDFATTSFKKQANAIFVLVKRLIVDVENLYMKLIEENEACNLEIKTTCEGNTTLSHFPKWPIFI